MGKVNVYLPDELERAVRDADLAMSPICQTALRDAVERITALRERGEGTFTPRLAAILDDARTEAAEAGRQVTAHHLFGAIVKHRENLGARAIESFGIELPSPKAPRAAKGDGELSGDAREVLASAYRISRELRHEHLGTEHVVLALAEPGSPIAHLFEALGIEPRALRQQVERLIANPWTTARGETADLVTLERLDAMVQQLTAEVGRLKAQRDDDR